MIECVYYAKYGDFPKKIDTKETLKVQKLALYAAAVTVGLGLDVKQHTLPREVVSWKLSMIDAFLDSSNGKNFAVKNIELLEASESGTIGFFFGMIFAHTIAQAKYSIPITFHLGDKKKISYKLKRGEKNYPDLFGIDHQNKGYLIEAKGSFTTTQSRSYKKTNEKARQQLEAVASIKFTHSNGTVLQYTYQKLTRLIANAYCKKVLVNPGNTPKIYEKHIVVDIIDPEPEKGDEVSIHSNEMSLKYYFNLVDILMNQTIESKSLNGQNFVLFSIPCHSEELKLGLLMEIYDIYKSQIKVIKKDMDKKRNYEDQYELRSLSEDDTYSKVNEILRPLEFTHKAIYNDPDSDFKYSIGPDGVIAMVKSL